MRASRGCVERTKRGDASGGGLCEFRLRTGHVSLVVPMIGALRHRDLFAITVSDDMAFWRVGGTYDRPIPRHIAEEAGVPRDLLGQEPLASRSISRDKHDSECRRQSPFHRPRSCRLARLRQVAWPSIGSRTPCAAACTAPAGYDRLFPDSPGQPCRAPRNFGQRHIIPEYTA